MQSIKHIFNPHPHTAIALSFPEHIQKLIKKYGKLIFIAPKLSIPTTLLQKKKVCAGVTPCKKSEKKGQRQKETFFDEI